jgi:hypothetical protein
MLPPFGKQPANGMFQKGEANVNRSRRRRAMTMDWSLNIPGISSFNSIELFWPGTLSAIQKQLEKISEAWVVVDLVKTTDQGRLLVFIKGGIVLPDALC